MVVADESDGNLLEAAKAQAHGPRLSLVDLEELVRRATSNAGFAGEMAVYVVSWGTFRRKHLGAVVAALLRIAADRTLPVAHRAQAAEGVGDQLDFSKQRTLTRRAELVLIDLLGDESADVRFWSAFSLGKLRSRRARPHLRRLLGDQAHVVGFPWTVGDEAADALTTIAGDEPPDRPLH